MNNKEEACFQNILCYESMISGQSTFKRCSVSAILTPNERFNKRSSLQGEVQYIIPAAVKPSGGSGLKIEKCPLLQGTLIF